MAANLHGSCVRCGKSGGVLFCTGCQQILCFKHVIEHKDQLENELEDLINEENHFEHSLSKNADSHELFSHIDKWKKDSIEQIKQIAKQAKDDLKHLINQSTEHLLEKCQQLKENLHLLKQSEDLSEIQLKKLSNQFTHLKNEINSFQLIQSSNSNFLKVEKKKEIQKETKPSIEKHSPNIEQTHSNTEGSISIREIDPYGHFIIVEHNGSTTDQPQDMVGWTLKRSIDSYTSVLYRFPNDFSLKSKSFVKILSRQASKTLYSYEKKNILIAETIQTWGTAVKTIINCLCDANGNEKDVLIQTFK